VILNRLAAVGALALAWSITPAPAAAQQPGGCACPTGPAQLLDQIDHVFIGDLVEVKGGGEETGVAVIRVRENFKGDLKGVVEVRDAMNTQCAWSVFEMALPGRFMVFANLDEGELVTPAFCPKTQPLSGWQESLVPYRAYARAQKAPTASKPAPANAGAASPSPKTGS
jgi:hypothetical protein